MGRGGSVLKNLKSDLQKHDLLQQKKRRKGDAAQARDRRERDRRALESIRDAFNPFDLKFNRQKSELKRTEQSEEPTGRPAASRQTGEEQRKRTWEAQKRLKNKTGGLVDRRFGEKDTTMSEEDKMIERYARERLNRSKKNFNLDDDDEEEIRLTHGGKALSFEDDFAEDDLGVSDGSDYETPREPLYDEREGLGEHASDENEIKEAPEEHKKSKQEVMKEVIAKSKMHKLERQQIRAQDDDIVDELNAGFDDLMADLRAAEANAPKSKEKTDTYDANVLEMMYDRRAQPGDRTKTAEEIAQEEEDRRKEAARALQARMEGDELDIGNEDEEIGNDGELFGLVAHSDEESSNWLDAQGEDSDRENTSGTKTSAIGAAIPETLDELKHALIDAVDPSTVIRGIASRAAKPRIEKFAVVLVEYACTVRSEFENTCTVLHDLASKPGVGVALANGIRDMVHIAKGKAKWNTSQLLLFALIGSLFSTSDQWHVVVTSASVVMTQRLSQAVASDMKEITNNLFLCDLLLTYQRLSKRYVPEVMGYFLRVLAILCPETADVADRYVRVSSEEAPVKAIDWDANGSAKLGKAMSGPEACVLIASLASKAASLWRSVESFPEIFAPLVFALKKLPTSNNRIIDESVDKISRLSRFSASERKFLELQQFRPIGIISKMPLFDENYNPDVRGSGTDPDRRELAKLKALHKKERKGTLREIRRDAEFEAREKLSEKRRDMAAYHDKLKRLEGQINGEEGAERNAYERERKKRRRR